jgi:hypothetical protein
LRVRQPVQQRVRHEHGGAEHGAVQRRRGVRVLLRAALRQRRAVVPAGHHHRHGHQLLPAKLRPSQRRRRMVQPAAPALRHGRARLPPHRAVPRRHRARRVQKVILWRLTTFWLDQPRRLVGPFEGPRVPRPLRSLVRWTTPPADLTRGTGTGDAYVLCLSFLRCRCCCTTSATTSLSLGSIDVDPRFGPRCWVDS